MRFGVQLSGAGQNRGSWLVLLFVLLAVLIPTVCVLWFTNQTINLQRETARQKLIEAYRSQLPLLRESLDVYWNNRRAELDLLARTGEAHAIFGRAVKTGLADAVICLNPNGSVEYPSVQTRTAVDTTDRRPDWVEARALENKSESALAAGAYARLAQQGNDASLIARALQAEVRCLLRAGHKQAATRLIREWYVNGSAARGTDLQGRIILANELLLALQQTGPSDPGYLQMAWDLREILGDYSGSPMPSSQRLFLISEFRRLQLGPEFENTQAYNAERLAGDFLGVGHIDPNDRALDTSALTGVWALSAPRGRVIALYRAETITAAMDHLLNEQNVSAVAAFRVLTPGARNNAVETTAAGSMLPGWRIALSFNEGTAFQDIVRRQTVSYMWAALLAIAVLTIAGICVGHAVHRQMRLARLKTDLVAAVSHELKTPLASMQLLTDALLEKDKFDPIQTREYLDMIAIENRRLARLIEGFLAFSRIQRNRHKFQFAEASVADIVHAAVDASAQRLSVAECSLDVEIGPDLPVLCADSDALVTVLLNLLDNACKFTAAEKRVFLRAFSKDGWVSFAVSDNGIGIPPSEHKKIFRSYYQVDRRLSREAGGCGLGLSIVQFIVKAHSGNVAVKSQLGLGSTFVVSLPSVISRNGAEH